MAIKCGNCTGYHETISEVRDCHRVSPAAGPRPTPKQTDFIRSLVAERADHGITDVDGLLKTLSPEKASNLINELLKKPRAHSTSRPGDIKGEIPKHGTYTVEFQNGDRRTIRFRKPHPKANFAIVEYLYGPDNENDFKLLGREASDGISIAPAFKARDGWKHDYLVSAVTVLLGANEELLAEMGFRYALASGNCYRCGRKLTVPASIHRGLGPKCARMVA